MLKFTIRSCWGFHMGLFLPRKTSFSTEQSPPTRFLWHPQRAPEVSEAAACLEDEKLLALTGEEIQKATDETMKAI